MLDLGAGTGKLTEALVALDREVIAVDPVEEMLEELEVAVPGVPRILGTAEDIPIEDAAVDAVVAGQAWHWFVPERAMPEIARVLKPGGVLGLVWNSRDTSVDWLRQAGEIMHERHDASATFESYVQIGPPFGEIEEHTVEWSERMSRARFLDLVRSRSYFITATPTEQAATIAALETLLATHPDLAGAEELAVPYVTRCFRARCSLTLGTGRHTASGLETGGCDVADTPLPVFAQVDEGAGIPFEWHPRLHLTHTQTASRLLP